MTDQTEATHDVDALTDLETGDQVILDGHRGRFTVLKPVRDPTGSSKIGVKALDGDGGVYELRLARTSETFIDVRPDDDNAPVRSVRGAHRCEDFEVVGRDKTVVEQFVRERWQ